MGRATTELALVDYCDGNNLDALCEGLKQVGLGQLTLDAAGVTRLASTTLQTLLSADRSCRARGGQLSLINISAEFGQMLALMGLEPQRFAAKGTE